MNPKKSNLCMDDAVLYLHDKLDDSYRLVGLITGDSINIMSDDLIDPDKVEESEMRRFVDEGFVVHYHMSWFSKICLRRIIKRILKERG